MKLSRLAAPRAESGGPHLVFFSTYEVKDALAGSYKAATLASGDVSMDGQVPETIGEDPDWRTLPNRSPYFMFNLHTLRFCCPLIRPAEWGETEFLERVEKILRKWWDANQPGRAASEYAWNEHAVSWRSVTLAYFWQLWRGTEFFDERRAQLYTQMALEHGAFLCQAENYMEHHNHGLNNALALLALGLSFTAFPQAKRWTALSLKRAEQQMRNNVSDDGIHLEQSGLYHCYTLRTYLEIWRSATAMGYELSASYTKKLDRMLGVAVSMAGPGGVIRGLPFSNPRVDALREGPLRGLVSLPPGFSGPGVQRFRDALEGLGERALRVHDEGGYAFFDSSPGREVKLVFHTRILRGPHGHRDAVGLYASFDGQEILALPSTMRIADRCEQWAGYFESAPAHNTVSCPGIDQSPPNPWRNTLPQLILRSAKFQRLVQRTGLTKTVAWLRRSTGLDAPVLRARSLPAGGTVMAHGSRPSFEFVTARHECLPGTVHYRTVARIAERLVVVRDRLNTDRKRCFEQIWHFALGLKVSISGGRGEARSADGVVARFEQLAPNTPGQVHTGSLSPLRGWYALSYDEPEPCATVSYARDGTDVEFIWVLQVGSEPLSTELIATAANDEDGLDLSVTSACGTIGISFRGHEVEVSSDSGQVGA